MRKRDDTLRDTLLAHAGEMWQRDGAEAINIRALAKTAGVSVGTVYNYFGGKDDILLALTEAYWRDTLRDMRGAIHGDTFVVQISEIYAFLLARMERAGAMLMGSLSNVEQTGREKMQHMQGVLRAALIQRMDQDAGIRQAVWSEAFSKAQYADFVMMNLLLLLRTQAPNIDFFLEVIRKTLY